MVQVDVFGKVKAVDNIFEILQNLPSASVVFGPVGVLGPRKLFALGLAYGLSMAGWEKTGGIRLYLVDVRRNIACASRIPEKAGPLAAANAKYSYRFLKIQLELTCSHTTCPRIRDSYHKW